MAEKMVAGCRLTTKIGEGPHGVVYRAEKPGQDEPLAVKILKPSVVPKDKEHVIKDILRKL